MRRVVFLFLVLCVTMSTVPVRAAEPAPPNRAVRGVYEGIRRVLQAVADRSTPRSVLQATLRSAFLDSSSRAFYYLTGSIRVAHPTPRFQSWMRSLYGRTITTNGSFAIDLSFPELVLEGSEASGVKFELTITCIPARIVESVVSNTVQVATLGVFAGMAGGLVPFLEHFNADLVGRAADVVVEDVVHFAVTDAGTEAAFLATGGNGVHVKDQRQARFVSSFKHGLSMTSVMHYLGETLLSLGEHTASHWLGYGLGAAVGAVLFPSGGAIIGAAFSIAAFPLIGSVVMTTLTVDIPLAYRMGKLRQLYTQLAADSTPNEAMSTAIDLLEAKVLRGVDAGIKADNYNYMDKVVDKIAALDGPTQRAFRPLLRKIQSKLMIVTVHDRNWNAARKHLQLLSHFRETLQPRASD